MMSMTATVTWGTVRGRRRCVATARGDRGRVLARVTIEANVGGGALKEAIEAEARQIVERVAKMEAHK